MAERINEEFMSDFEKFRNFFAGSKKAFGQKDSESYTRVKEQFMNSYNTIAALQNQTVTQENSKQMYEARRALTEICASYVKENENRRIYSGTGQKRMNTIKDVLSYMQKDDFSQLRDPNAINQYAGKKWNEIKEMPAERLEIGNVEDKVAGLANERYFVKNGATKGFFTPQKMVLSEDAVFDDTLKEVNNAEQAKFLKSAEDILKMHASSVCEASQLGVNEYYALQVETYREIGRMESQQDRESFNKIYSEHFDKMIRIREEIQNNHPEVKTGSAEENNKRIEDIIGNIEFNGNKEKNEEIQALFLENKERLLDFATKKTPELKGDEASEMQLDALLLADGGARSLKLLNDPETKKHALNIMKKIQASENLMSKELAGFKPNDELTGRNTASSRLADEFGVGNLLARSKDVTAQINGKEVKGCYMEFAEGIDLRNSHGDDLKTLNEMNFTNTPTLNRDVCNLEMLDYICAQADRHAGNIFLKVDPNTKQPIGLQGIDNDMCLTERYPKDLIPIGKNNRIPMKQPELKDLHFMSEDMAKKIQNVTPSQLRRLVGDKISEKDFLALEARVGAVKDHIQNHVFLVKNDADWSLENYDNLVKPANLQGKDKEARELFDKARKELENGLNPDIKDGPKHQNASILAEVNKAKKRYQKELEEKEKVSQKAAPEAQKETPQPEKQRPESEMKGQGMVDNRSKETFWKKGKTGNGAVETNLNDLENEKEAPEPEKQSSESEMKSQGMTDNRSKETLAKKNHIVQNPKFGTKSKEVDPSKTAAKIEDLTEDGTVKLKTYSDGKKIKIYTSSDGQVIKTDTYAADGDKRNRMSLTDIIKNMKDHNEVAQRDGDEREAAKKEQKEEIKRENEKMNPIKDEMGNIREPGKQTTEKNNKSKVDNGVRIGAHREKDNSFKAELDRSKERKTNLKLGAHRENMGMKNEHTKQNAVKNGREM